MVRRISQIGGALLCAMALAASAAYGQIRLGSTVVGSGGGRASSGSMVMNGTIGQGVIGPTGSSTVKGWQGFWYTLAPPPPSSVEDERGWESVAGSAAIRSSPNPFSQQTELRVLLPKPGQVSLALYDALGHPVRTLFRGNHEAGTLSLQIDAAGLESGTYMVHLMAAGTQTTHRLVVVK